MKDDYAVKIGDTLVYIDMAGDEHTALATMVNGLGPAATVDIKFSVGTSTGYRAFVPHVSQQATNAWKVPSP